ncbi:MAG: malate dehydrogenase [Candidatus Micrarchaeaceae archaeon]
MGRKVSIIGAGKVGATTAHLIALKGLADVVIVNRTAGTAQGIALDIREGMPIEGLDVNVAGSGDYSAIAGSDIVVVTAGAQRKEGMSRDDLLKINSQIVSEAAGAIKQYAPDSIVIVVTNPLDAMAYLMMRNTGFGKSRVIGMAGALDSSRFAAFIAEELRVSVKEVSTMILGSHGDSMVPLISQTTVKGVQVAKLIEKSKLDSIIARARDGGAEIIKLEQSSAYYAPASSVVSMVEAILKDSKKVIPCSAYLDGEYGHSGIFLGVPVALGRDGIEKIVVLEIPDDEKKMLDESASKISVMMSQIS